MLYEAKDKGLLFRHELQTHDNFPKVLKFITGRKTKENGGVKEKYEAFSRLSNKEIKKAKASDFSGDLSFNFFRI